MTAKPGIVFIRPVPCWMIGDWLIALGFASMTLFVLSAFDMLRPLASIPGIGIIWYVAATLPFWLAIRQAGSLGFSDEGIVLTRLLVPYRRVAWRDIESAFLFRQSDEDGDPFWEQVFLVLRGNEHMRFPIIFSRGRHVPGSRAYRANEMCLRQMAARGIVIHGLEALDRG